MLTVSKGLFFLLWHSVHAQTAVVYKFSSTSIIFLLYPCIHCTNSCYSFQPIHFLPRDSYAKRGICRRRVSVCVSVTFRYCIKMAKHRIT